MQAPRVNVDASSVLALGAVVVVGVVAWFAWGKAKAAAGAVGQAVADAEQAFVEGTANISQWFGNQFSAPATQTLKALQYSDYAYTGVDPATGQVVTDGEWYDNADARRYSAAQRAAGGAPAAESINGAAFGVYPKP